MSAETPRRSPNAAAQRLALLHKPGLCTLLVTCALAAWPEVVPADSAPPETAGARPGDGQPDLDDSPEEKAERRRIAIVMVYIVAGIAVAGIALIVLILLGGHRLRQRVRSRTGRSADLDPLWYLRSAGKHVSEDGGDLPGSGESADEARDRGSKP